MKNNKKYRRYILLGNKCNNKDEVPKNVPSFVGMANPVAGMSEEEALKKAAELGDGKDMGTWRTMSGEQFMKWWRESNRK